MTRTRGAGPFFVAIRLLWVRAFAVFIPRHGYAMPPPSETPPKGAEQVRGLIVMSVMILAECRFGWGMGVRR